jgi:hypothetical protein
LGAADNNAFPSKTEIPKMNCYGIQSYAKPGDKRTDERLMVLVNKSRSKYVFAPLIISLQKPSLQGKYSTTM